MACEGPVAASPIDVGAQPPDVGRLVHGDQFDRIIPPSTVARFAARYHGRAQFEQFEGFSHWLIGEKGWEQIAARALTWLDTIEMATAVREPS